MNVKIVQRLAQIRPSATIAVSHQATAMRAAGRDVLSLAVGEPDFDTPEHIRAAAVAAIEAGDTHYPPIAGSPALNAAIRNKLARDNQLDFGADQIVVTCGAKQAIFNALMALVGEGDEVIVPSPYWVSYPDMIRIAGGEPVILNTGEKAGFKITARQLESAITDNTRVLLLNSPSNPTGKVYSAEEFRALGRILRDQPRMAIICDDIYEHIYWGRAPYRTLLNECPELAARTVLVNGVSKAYAMTGWRIGFAAGPERVISAMRKIQGQSTSGACSISQAAAVAALEGPQECLEPMRREYRRRHDFAVPALNDIPGVNCPEADGAFYLFPSFSAIIGKHPEFKDDIDLAAWLLQKAEVALVPGSAFGAPNRMRLSFAVGMDVLEAGIARIARTLATLA